MSQKVIVTRTQPGADETATNLVALGYQPVVSPMLRIVETGLDTGLLTAPRDLIFTSANGVRAFVSSGAAAADFAAWCVGPSTSVAAREAGFGRVIEGDGDADDLARLILAARTELTGPALHIANDAAAGHLVSALQAAGMDVRFAAPYRTEAAPSLSADALEALASGRAAMLIHSAKGAAAIAASGAALDQAWLVAISKAAARPLKGQPCAGLTIAARPNEDALMAALGEALPLP
ncbi:MAG: uroporphyrinogen-III synthase [Hyphomonas sp.]